MSISCDISISLIISSVMLYVKIMWIYDSNKGGTDNSPGTKSNNCCKRVIDDTASTTTIRIVSREALCEPKMPSINWSRMVMRSPVRDVYCCPALPAIHHNIANFIASTHVFLLSFGTIVSSFTVHCDIIWLIMLVSCRKENENTFPFKVPYDTET